MDQTGRPHGLPLSSNGLSPAPGGPWTSVVVACSSPDLGGTSEARTALVNGFKARDPSGQRSPPSHS
jgi:hypothetical protein